jgi:cystathionine beta-lyase/cystathionine gamma-synthase
VDLIGAKLAGALVSAGTVADDTWWSGYLFDKALSHGIHVQVMVDIDTKYGHGADENVHRILNQAMYDVAQALGNKNVKLAPLH